MTINVNDLYVHLQGILLESDDSELTVGIVSGPDDPTVVDVTDGGDPLPVGTIYIRSGVASPQLFVKANTGATDWEYAAVVSDPDAGTGVLGTGSWRFETATTTPPGNARFRFNNANPLLATELYIDYDNESGADLTNILNAVSAPALIYAQLERDASNGFLARITADPVDNGTYVTYAIDDVTDLGPDPLVTNRGYYFFLSGLGGGAGGITVEEDDALVASGTTTLNFEGNGVSTTDEGGGKVTVTVTDTDNDTIGVNVELNDTGVSTDERTLNFEGTAVTSVVDEGGKTTITLTDTNTDTDTTVEVQNNDATVVSVLEVLNFEGSAVTSVVDEGSGKVTVTLTDTDTDNDTIGVNVELNDTGVSTDERTLNFEGTGVTSVVDEGGKTTITVTDTDTDTIGINIEQNDGSISTDERVLNFEGTGVTSVTDEGGKTTVVITDTDTDTTIDVQDDDVSVVNPVTTLNFEGALTVTDDGGGKATVTVAAPGVGPQAAFDGYFTTGPVSIDAGWTDVPLDVQRVIDGGAFSHTTPNPNVVIGTAGRYAVTARVTTETSVGTTRTDSEVKIQVNDGSGFADVPGSFGAIYNRTLAQGRGTATIKVILDLAVGDQVKVQAQRGTGPDSLIICPDACSLTIESLEGVEGEQGIQGPPGNDGADGADGADGNSVTVQEDDVNVVANIATLNFDSGFDVTDNGGSKATVSLAPSVANANRLFRHNGNNTTVLTPTEVTVEFQELVRQDAAFAYSAGEITINDTGWYRLSVDIQVQSNATRSAVFGRLERNAGAGFLTVEGTEYGIYCRTNQSYSLGGFTILLNVTSGDIIRVRIAEDTGTPVLIGQGQRIVLERVT